MSKSTFGKGGAKTLCNPPLGKVEPKPYVIFIENLIILAPPFPKVEKRWKKGGVELYYIKLFLYNIQ